MAVKKFRPLSFGVSDYSKRRNIAITKYNKRVLFGALNTLFSTLNAILGHRYVNNWDGYMGRVQ